MTDQLDAALGLLPGYLAHHVLLSAAALALGIAISLPLALFAARDERVRFPVLALASLVQTIPGLALLALFYPLLLGLSALLGLRIPALGFLPALLALTLYAMLPILRNAVAGLDGIDPDVIAAADGVGMTARQRLLRVEIPLATPVAMAGIRTAAVWTIGTATLATPVGQTSLGNFIFAGLQTENWVFVLVGCAAAAMLAMLVDGLLGLVETGTARREIGRAVSGLAGLTLGVIVALVPLATATPKAYTIGAKNFSEQFILAELIGARLAREGVAVEHRQGLGSAVIFRALAAGDIDVYVDYAGTLWTNVMGRRDPAPRGAMLAEITAWMRDQHGVTVLGPLGFENAYALAMKRDRAATLRVATIADLTSVAPQLTLGGDLEFLSRPEWAALKSAYGLNFRAQRSYNPTFMYRALATEEADVISAFSSDGRIAAQNLTVLADPKGALPSYDALILISPRRADDATLRRALTPLLFAIPAARMREANYMVDRDSAKATPEDAARFLAQRLNQRVR